MTIARQVKAGTFVPGIVALGEKSHVVTLVLNPALTSVIPAATRQRIDSLQTRMLAGDYSVKVDSAPAKH